MFFMFCRAPVVLGILQLLLLPWCPESPRFLLMDRFDSNGSTKALSWLRYLIKLKYKTA